MLKLITLTAWENAWVIVTLWKPSQELASLQTRSKHLYFKQRLNQSDKTL